MYLSNYGFDDFPRGFPQQPYDYRGGLDKKVGQFELFVGILAFRKV